MAQRIVVGVDGSSGSEAALRWAIDEAGRRGAYVEAVHVWHPAYVGGYPYTTAAFDPGELEASAKAILDEAIAALGAVEIRVDPVVECGSAASALVERAKGADLLVVGSRGRGGFAGLLLGSVSQQVAHHAPCPVVIVPAE
jgi:nucleotide-binding universal stress UspA family protein